MSRQLGLAAEEQACNYLLKQGLVLLATNYQCRWGEIDLIMKDREYIVFIEVRARSCALFGGPFASITAAKKNKIIKTANHFILTKNWTDKYPVRFDVIGIEQQKLQWLKDAF
ncbi:YraN family protein [Legionella gresilensis]|uniref:YraN family protein n=1 Tax=Legionella gresilensis TaxID=91823 RepID=UPI0010413FA3|nr:YraN family protein [Legionella gresilensis]